MAADPCFEAVLGASERVAFRIDDVLPGDARLDFTKPFLPETLVRSEQMPWLAPRERLAFHHIRAHTYLCTFRLVEAFILPFVVDHARADVGGDPLRTRALLTFAAEEAKHIQLFERFRVCFERGFGSPCAFVGPPERVARDVLGGHGPLGVAWAILHIEWMTQRHYLESVRDRPELEPQFTALLKHHWLEEAQHTKLDAAMVERLAAQLSPRDLAASAEEYLHIVAALAELFEDQLEHELDSLARVLARPLRAAERDAAREVQRRALRTTFITAGMSHPSFLAMLEQVTPEGAARVRSAAQIAGSAHQP